LAVKKLVTMSSANEINALSNNVCFKGLCDSSGVGLMSVDQDLVVRYCNRSAAELLSTEVDHLVGKHITQFLGEQHRGIIARMAQRAISQNNYSEFEFRYHQAEEDRVLYLAVTISPLRDQSGQNQGASACIRDVTRCVQLQEQLGQDHKMRALSAMAGSLAHHFNNILGSIVTNVDFASQSNDSRVHKRALNSTAEALQKASKLLDGLLAFAEGDFRDEDQADLTETILHFVDRIEPQLAERGIGLSLNLSRIPVVAILSNHILTVLRHVVDNALEAMHQAGQLCIELEADEGQAICRIIDSGPGIASQDLERVFEPFYSTKDPIANSSDRKHHGLGLSMAFGIINEIGGAIEISSSAGQSTIVEIRLPIDPDKPIKEKIDPAKQFSLLFAPKD